MKYKYSYRPRVNDGMVLGLLMLISLGAVSTDLMESGHMLNQLYAMENRSPVLVAKNSPLLPATAKKVL